MIGRGSPTLGPWRRKGHRRATPPLRKLMRFSDSGPQRSLRRATALIHMELVRFADLKRVVTGRRVTLSEREPVRRPPFLAARIATPEAEGACACTFRRVVGELICRNCDLVGGPEVGRHALLQSVLRHA